MIITCMLGRPTGESCFDCLNLNTLLELLLLVPLISGSSDFEGEMKSGAVGPLSCSEECDVTQYITRAFTMT